LKVSRNSSKDAASIKEAMDSSRTSFFSRTLLAFRCGFEILALFLKLRLCSLLPSDCFCEG
jgi:hypothetical protein